VQQISSEVEGLVGGLIDGDERKGDVKELVSK
jgi:hypothetical protein